MFNEFLNNDFWRIAENGVRIYKPEYFRFLEKNGFGKMYMDGEKLKPTYVRVKNNVARVVSRDTMITYSRLYIEYRISVPNSQNEVFDAFIEKVLSKPDSTYSMLNVLEINFLTDSKETIYIYFKNKIIAVERDKINEISYLEAPGVIWEDQIIEFDIELNLQEDFFNAAEFNEFLKNISSANNQEMALQRYMSILSIIGYLIHEYRDLSNMKAIILMDSNLSATPEGGAGKGLLIQAIKLVRNTAFEDGKNFDFNTRFSFQQVKPSTKVLFFDDVTKKFDFERLFSTITDGIIIERKYRDRFIIPAEKSPRIVVSTNYSILGNGGSFERRKLEFEFSSHYSKDHSPADEFGHLFFKEWNRDEWIRFFNLLFFACGKYLRIGLVEAPSINRELKYLIHATSPEFYEYAQDNIQLDTRYNKKTIYEDFIRQFPDYTSLKQRTFTSWLRIYARVKSLNILEPKSDRNYYLILSAQLTL